MADEQGLQCVRGNEGQEAGLSQLELHSTEAVTTLRRGQEESKKGNLLARSVFLRLSHLFSLLPTFHLPVFHLLAPSHKDRLFRCVSRSWACPTLIRDQCLETCRHHCDTFWRKHRAADSFKMLWLGSSLLVLPGLSQTAML